MATVTFPPKEIFRALGMHAAYISGLENFHFWMSKKNNKTKAELASIIYGIIELQRLKENEIFPSYEELTSGTLISKSELQKFNIGHTKFYFTDLTPGHIIYEKARNLDSFYWKNWHNEYLANKLSKYLNSKEFLDAWEQLEVQDQAEYFNLLADRLSETIQGRKFIAESQFIKDNNTGCFHFSRLEIQIDYLNDLYSSLKNKNEKLFENVQDLHSKVKVVNDVLGNLMKISPLISNATINAIENVSTLKKIRRVFYNGSISVIQFIDEDILDEFGDYIETKTNWDPEIDDNFEDFFKWFRKNISEKYNTIFPTDFEDGQEIRVDKKGIFFRLNCFISIVGVAFSIVALMKDKNNKRKKLELTISMIEAVDSVNELSSFIRGKEKAFIKTGTQAFKVLKVGLGVANLVGVVLSVVDAMEAHENEDMSVMAGNLSLAVAGVITATLVIGETFTITGLASAYTGLGLILFVIGMFLNIVGSILILFTQDPRLERWFRYNYFGVFSNISIEDAAMYTPKDLQFGFYKDFYRQIIKFNSLVFANGVELKFINRDLEPIEHEISEIPILQQIFYSKVLAKPNWKWEDEYMLFEIEIKNLRFHNNKLELGLKLWSDTGFFWNSGSNTITIFAEGNNQTPLPSNWDDKNLIFKKHNYFSIKYENIETGEEISNEEEKINSITVIDKFSFEFFVKKEMIIKKPNDKNILEQCELELSFSNKEIESTEKPKMIFLLASDVVQ